MAGTPPDGSAAAEVHATAVMARSGRSVPERPVHRWAARTVVELIVIGVP